MKPKPIQTRYAGHHFRSRLEARWAVLFDAAGIEWEYEVEGYSLPSGWYLPDFWLPQVMMWAEVKRTRLDGQEFSLCKDLAVATGFHVLLLDGRPEMRLFSAISTDLLAAEKSPIIAHYDILEGHHYWLDESRFFHYGYGELLTRNYYSEAPRYWIDEPSGGGWQEESWVEKANSARFEHGQQGAA